MISYAKLMVEGLGVIDARQGAAISIDGDEVTLTDDFVAAWRESLAQADAQRQREADGVARRAAKEIAEICEEIDTMADPDGVRAAAKAAVAAIDPRALDAGRYDLRGVLEAAGIGFTEGRIFRLR